MTPGPDLDRTAVTPTDWLPGYEMLSVIGTGGFGTVFKARQHKLDRVVALKVVQLDPATQPALAARLENEAVTLGRLHHPNIVQVYDYGFHAGRMFIAMELLDGEDLGQPLKRDGKIDERTMWAIARQTASALAHAAGHGVIHRDIKPPNLVLVPAPAGLDLPPDVPLVKVTDFGLARTKWAADAEGRLTAPGAVLGTPLYMAPEQYRGSADLDHRVDIYALGATVFHALAGRPPFAGENVWDVMVQKMGRSPRSLPAIPPASAALVGLMMAPDVADRVPTYEDLIARIDRLRLGGAAPRAGRPWWQAAVGAAAVLTVAALGIHVGLPASTRVAAVDGGPGPRYVSGGAHEALFDSATLHGWRPHAAGGAWRVDRDDEGATVLTGTGFVRRPFAAPADYRLTIGLDVGQATAAEVHFGLPAGGPDATAVRYVLRVSRQAGAVFGTKAGDRAPFRPLGAAVPFPPAAWFDGRRPYLEVRIQRAGGAWSAWFNGTEAGRAADDGGPKAAEVRLNAEGGPARVDSVILEALERAE
ncbi:MAG TPA: serine/threonine-protein kinase [Gemmataceae bacterium]|jgi:tRNA A-37 threonylcarbamoyl transferase component Bud32